MKRLNAGCGVRWHCATRGPSLAACSGGDGPAPPRDPTSTARLRSPISRSQRRLDSPAGAAGSTALRALPCGSRSVRARDSGHVTQNQGAGFFLSLGTGRAGDFGRRRDDRDPLVCSSRVVVCRRWPRRRSTRPGASRSRRRSVSARRSPRRSTSLGKVLGSVVAGATGSVAGQRRWWPCPSPRRPRCSSVVPTAAAGCGASLWPPGAGPSRAVRPPARRPVA